MGITYTLLVLSFIAIIFLNLGSPLEAGLSIKNET
jgi:hypothetical protein